MPAHNGAAKTFVVVDGGWKITSTCDIALVAPETRGESRLIFSCFWLRATISLSDNGPIESMQHKVSRDDEAVLVGIDLRIDFLQPSPPWSSTQLSGTAPPYPIRLGLLGST